MQSDSLFTVDSIPFGNWKLKLKTRGGPARLLLLCTLVLLLYLPVLSGFAQQFVGDPNYSHGFLIPCFSAYLIWLKREQLVRSETPSSFIGFGVVFASIVLLYLGSIGAELFLTRLSFVLIVIGLILYFQGEATVRQLAFPLAYLFLMIPLPAIIFNHIVFPLQILSSRLATKALRTINVMPVLREGNLLILPRCTLEVVEACSGIRSLMSLLALALAYGYLAESAVSVRLLLILAMIPVAIVANALRVVLTALVAEHTGPQILDSWLHPVSSMLVFFVAVLLLLLIHAGIRAVQGRLRANAVS
jgi:exosortase